MTKLAVFLIAAVCHAQIVSQFYDSKVTGAVTAEKILTPTAAMGGLKKLCQYPETGDLYVQPLYVPGITVAGRMRNLLIVPTMANNVYAFDADVCPTVLWSANFGATFSPSPAVGIYMNRQIGCASTPVADIANGWLFVVCDNGAGAWQIRKLNLATGAVITTTAIIGQVSGIGAPGDSIIGGMLQFTPAWHNQRLGLAIDNGNVLVGFSALFESGAGSQPYHGWFMAYSESALAQTAIFCDTPNGLGAGLWGGAPSIDSSNNIYLVTGNGDWNGSTNFGTSILKLNSSLALQDWFTPSNWAAINAADADIGSNRAILISGTNFLVSGGKDFVVRVLNITDLGHLEGGGGTAPHQTFSLNGTTPGTATGSYGEVWLNNTLYLPTTNGSTYICSYNVGTTLFTTPCTASAATHEFPGAVISGSSNGVSTGIIWSVEVVPNTAFDAPTVAVIEALNPSDLTTYWSSGGLCDCNPSFHPLDSLPAAGPYYGTQPGYLGNLSKYAIPTVANGVVYISTQSGFVASYGITLSSGIGGNLSFGGKVSQH